MQAKTARSESNQTSALVGFLVGLMVMMLLMPALDRLDGKICVKLDEIGRAR